MVSVGMIVAAHNSLCSNHIYKAGREEQKREVFRSLTTGEWIGCWALTEPEAGSDAGHAKQRGDQGDVLDPNGSKTFITNAQYADVVVTMAVTDRAASQQGLGIHGGSDMVRDFAWGRKRTSSACGQRDRRTIFTNCRLPGSQLLGKPGEGFMDSLKYFGRRARLHRGFVDGTRERRL